MSINYSIKLKPFTIWFRAQIYPPWLGKKYYAHSFLIFFNFNDSINLFYSELLKLLSCNLEGTYFHWQPHRKCKEVNLWFIKLKEEQESHLPACSQAQLILRVLLWLSSTEQHTWSCSYSLSSVLIIWH